MKLHRLEMTAIGPFTETVEVDFTKLGEHGLFLLEGPTGSGKSTVIDAISFALYGRVAQASADNERLRSHHTAPHVVPVVDLVFETQSGIYRIRRTPQYLRPKRSGTGTTKQQATIKLWRLTSPDDTATGEPLSTSFREADDEIQRAIGLNHSQFVQTMVLPQGEFATFLKSDTDDKRRLLQRLFGTEVVARTQAQLVEGRREAIARRESAEQSVDRALHAFGAAAALDSEHVAALALAPVEQAVDLASQHVTAIATVRDSASTAARSAGRALKKAQRAYDVAVDLLARRARRHSLRVRAAALEAAADTINQLRQRLTLAESAALVQPAATALARAVEQLQVADRRADSAREALPAHLTQADETALAAASVERQTLVGQLRALLQVEQRLASRRDERQALLEAIDAHNATLATLQAEAAQLPASLAAAEAARGIAMQQAALVDTLEAERVRAANRLAAALAAVEAERAAKQDEQITMEAFGALEAHEARLQVLWSTHRASIAADLGLALQVGMECQVCGSVDHPRPARPGSDYVSKEEVEREESRRVQLVEQADRARAQLEAHRLRLRELQTAADENPPETAAERLAEVETRLASARSARTRVEGLTRECTELRERQGALAASMHRTELQLAQATERQATLYARIVEDEQSVADNRGDFDSVADRVATLAHELEILQLAHSLVGAATVAREAALASAETFSAALADQGFASEAAWRAASVPAPQLAELRAEVRTVDDEIAAVRDGLTDPTLQDPALDAEAPDLDTLEAVVGAAESRATTAEHDLATATQRHAAAAAHLDALRSAVESGRQVLAETAPAIRLGNLVSGNGDNRMKMELTTYVLVRRFNDVIASANAQLRRICDGRYELEHTESRSGNARSGLGLRVHDHVTGMPRDPKTLSGGEAFYVALSLALGLADVVRSESGGVDMGTLFIDEGFGSLDPGTLDEVMSVLDSLRAGGRAVGIVSHVQELKSRIADRIEVIPRADRSSRLKVIA